MCILVGRTNGAHGVSDGLSLAALRAKIDSQASTNAPIKSNLSTLIVPCSTSEDGTHNKVTQLYVKITPHTLIKTEGSSTYKRCKIAAGWNDITPVCWSNPDAVPRAGGQVKGKAWVKEIISARSNCRSNRSADALRMCHLARLDVSELVCMAPSLPGVIVGDDYKEQLALFARLKNESSDPLLDVTVHCTATLNPEATALHFDNIKGPSNVEWSLSCAKGEFDQSISPPRHGHSEYLREGGVYLWQYKVASLNIHGEVIDHLCCPDVLHGSKPASTAATLLTSRNVGTSRRKRRKLEMLALHESATARRGAWARVDSHLRYFPHGVGLTDWPSR